MKKTFILLMIVSFLSTFNFAQQVDRQMVVVEIGTGTWCGYCPGAAMGADDLVENGHNVAILEHHSGDSYENTYSQARVSYYNITGFPTAFFDGVLSVVGGSATASMYGSYLPKVNQRNAVQSDFTVDIDFVNNGGTDYTATVTIEKVSTNTQTVVAHLAVTESHIPENWNGMTEVNFVTRLMVPDQNGTPLDFSGGNTETLSLDFSLQSGWDASQCELVAFVQDNSSKEILQGMKKTMAIPNYNYDAGITEIISPADVICGSAVHPTIIIKNNGGENLTSLDIEYSINGGSVSTHNWTGDLAFNLTEEVELPEISFSPSANNSLEVTLGNPNGQQDEDPTNNQMTKDFDTSPQVTSTNVYLELKTDNYPEETTWELIDDQGTVLYQGGPYNGQAGTTFNETFELDDTGCYEFIIYDAYGDGICCDYGQGYYELSDEDGDIFAQGGQFGSQETKPFERYEEGVLTADFVADETSIAIEEVVNFSDLSMGNITSWSWEFEGGTPATSTEQNPTVTYNTDGVFDVKLTISDGNNSDIMLKEDYITVVDYTGINEQLVKDLTVYPNPFNDKALVSFKLENKEQISYKIFNLLGELIHSQSMGQMDAGEQAIEINGSGYETGVYFIQLNIGNEVITEKVSLIK